MSGGHYDYAYNKVSDMANQMEAELARQSEHDPPRTPEREAFATLLWAVSDAMRAVELVASEDRSALYETEAIMRCLDRAVKLRERLGRVYAERVNYGRSA
mgnify:CR=1 FL=1